MEKESKKEKIDMNDWLFNIAKDLIKRYKFKTIPGKKQDEIYIYIDGVYLNCGREFIKSRVEKIMGSYCKTYYVNEILNRISRKTYVERSKFGNNNPDLVCVKNGVLNITTRELLPHSSDYCFLNKIPVVYNSGSKCFKMDEFVKSILYDDDIECLQEWFGYQLYKKYVIKKAVILRGPKNTGKTQLINVLKCFVGEDNCSGKSLQMLSQGKWQLADLYNKYANISDELSKRALDDVDFLKSLTGDSPIGGEIKFGDSFNFISYAKLTFGCNKIPYIKVEDDDEAYFDRWMIFDFDNRFDNDNPQTKLEVWRDVVEDEDEMSGVLNWALDGLDRLMKNKKFSYCKRWKDNRDIMLKENPVYGFVKSCCSEMVGNKITKAELFKRYEEYCALTNKTSLYEIWKFGKELRNYCDWLEESNEKGVAYWKNIKYSIPDLL